jgi:hypothetical protein
MTCKFCGDPTIGNSEMCDACWEVTSRLEKFVQSENGFEHVMVILIKNLGSISTEKFQQTIQDING